MDSNRDVFKFASLVNHVWTEINSIDEDEASAFTSDWRLVYNTCSKEQQYQLKECWFRLIWINQWKKQITSGHSPGEYESRIDVLVKEVRKLNLRNQVLRYQQESSEGLKSFEVDEYNFMRPGGWLKSSSFEELRDYVIRLIGLRNRVSVERALPIYQPSRDPSEMRPWDRKLLIQWARNQMDIVEKMLLSDAYPEGLDELKGMLFSGGKNGGRHTV